MIGASFERPLIVFVGLGFPRQLNNATDALQVLNELPHSYHGPAHAAAVRACKAAIAGEVEAETARGIVEAYSRQHGMLAQDLLAPFALVKCADLLGA